ncbi:glycosyltransferase family 2 protein [Clostridium sp. OS1-26]|uniref:glycosyltransferase family 2 protein n=1 Tax=Clostridium sp. OS1-26 TaxID=3070681 RepID=UPI0027E1F924|nr:glycosyltransferase family 2 protein [Clostridium sp. OS1-26]WML35845.1 glycosyltransferase family 2 protein [Clostridium sp. OS1-26]
MDKIEASVIMPTYNRKDLIELSLYSFNNQEYPVNKFEVIVIDDGSSDGTYNMIKSLKVNYKLKLLRNEKNYGAAFCRNKGIKIANGDIIIFSDSDCIVPPNFISGHLKYHETSSNIVVCALISWKKVFSIYYSKFDSIQKSEFEYARRNIPKFNNRLIDIDFNYKNNFKILFKDDIKYINKFSYIPDWSEGFLGKTIKTFGITLEKFQYPWVFFGTGNVSIRKRHIIDAGGFDTTLLREEDWDLGYRLYKKGIKFICALELESSHQEHVIVSKREEKMINSYKRIFSKYGDTEMLLFCLFNENIIDLVTLSNGVSEYKMLLQNRERYESVIYKFNLLLKYRANSFLEKKKKTNRFINIDNELRMLSPIKYRLTSFIKIFNELSRVTALRFN